MINRDRFTDALDRFHSLKALCIGDVMLDQYFYGAVHRISPEAPVPVLSIDYHRSMLGGAGNVARNIAALEATCNFFTITGADNAGYQIVNLLGQESRINSYVTTDRARVSSTKLRYVAGDQHLMRADHEIPSCVPVATLQQMLKGIEQDIANNDVIILSDYRKGLFTDAFCERIMPLLRAAGKPVIVDTKARDFRVFEGATIITPNIAEMQAIAGRVLLSDDEIAVAAEELMYRCRIENVLVTRGHDGMLLITKQGDVHAIPAIAQSPCDVSGAGDTVCASIALGIAAGLTVAEAAFLSNVAAGIAVTHTGTYAVAQQDLRLALIAEERIGGKSKIMLQINAFEAAQQWKREGKRIGFANGCFDLLHASHVMFLQEAREHCDKLMIGLNSDESVRALKGEGRPVNDELHRALMLAALPCVDAVIIFESESPSALVSIIKPDVLLKGEEYAGRDIPELKALQSHGGQLITLKRNPDYSTSKIIEKAQGIHLAVSH